MNVSLERNLPLISKQRNVCICFEIKRRFRSNEIYISFQNSLPSKLVLTFAKL